MTLRYVEQGEVPIVLSKNWHTASKEYKCAICGKRIKEGDRYCRVFGGTAIDGMCTGLFCIKCKPEPSKEKMKRASKCKYQSKIVKPRTWDGGIK